MMEFTSTELTAVNWPAGRDRQVWFDITMFMQEVMMGGLFHQLTRVNPITTAFLYIRQRSKS